ncbi:Trypsin-like peptidase domain [Phytophthora infestans]|uniref:Serine protease n=1 Tax=Phytophthora infestans TaxID=4787 RepID=A0A8S9TIL2_PHYIN|nr:Trypsin-like peptidase domain [Phytophthora infestans]
MTLPKTLFSFFSLVVALQVASGIEYTDTGIAIVGTTELLDVNVTAGTSHEDLISYEFASYIAVHFAGFNLPEGDSVVISSPDVNVAVSHTYTGRGRQQTGTFIASFVPGNSVTVTYTSVGPASAGQGYRITGFSRGYPTMHHESVCGDGDQSLPAKCYAPGTNLSEHLPDAYTKAQAVARLLVNGTYLCTGWLGGSEGHLFTNHHCFEQEDWVLTTDIEFAAESSSCSEQCETQLGCPGTLVATASTLIADSEDIDYSVVQLPDCVDLSPYGYLQMRESGPVVNESIYVPQHPDGYAKRIVSTVDRGDSTTVLSVGKDGNCGTEQVRHNADTKGGSSGSPLISSKDNLVVGIHHCGGCANTAIDSAEYAQTPCAAQMPKNATAPGQNHNMPCHGSNMTNVTTTTSNSTLTVTTSNSSITTTSNSPTLSPLGTATVSIADAKNIPSPIPDTTSTSTVTSKSTAALTSASVVTSSKSTEWALSDSATTPTTSTNSSNTTTVTSTNTTSASTTVKTARRELIDFGSASAASPTSTTAANTVDNDLIVGKLKAAVGIEPECTPNPTPAASVTTTPRPTTPNPTPAASVTTTPKPILPNPTPAASVTATPRPTTPNPTPATSVTTTSMPTTPNPTPASRVTTTPKPHSPNPTPVARVTSTPKPTTPSPTPATGDND